MATRAAAKSLNSNASSVHVGLKGLPRTALPNDLLRLCGKAKVGNVAHVAINYKRFRPIGTATLAFTRPGFVPAAMKALDKTMLGGKTLRVLPWTPTATIPRRRGQQGLQEALERGVITGDGPDAGLSGGAKNVVMYGLPGKTTAAICADHLRDFKLAGMEQGRPVVIKVESEQLASTSRFLVRLESVSEAYRLVRTLHMRKWRSDLFGDKYTIRAAVVA